MKTKIVLIPVDYSNARKACEHLENSKYKNHKQLAVDILGELDGEDEGVLTYDMSNFMDAVNNQDLDVLTNYFISYVEVNEK